MPRISSSWTIDSRPLCARSFGGAVSTVRAFPWLRCASAVSPYPSSFFRRCMYRQHSEVLAVPVDGEHRRRAVGVHRCCDAKRPSAGACAVAVGQPHHGHDGGARCVWFWHIFVVGHLFLFAHTLALIVYLLTALGTEVPSDKLLDRKPYLQSSPILRFALKNGMRLALAC